MWQAFSSFCWTAVPIFPWEKWELYIPIFHGTPGKGNMYLTFCKENFMSCSYQSWKNLILVLGLNWLPPQYFTIRSHQGNQDVLCSGTGFCCPDLKMSGMKKISVSTLIQQPFQPWTHFDEHRCAVDKWPWLFYSDIVPSLQPINFLSFLNLLFKNWFLSACEEKTSRVWRLLSCGVIRLGIKSLEPHQRNKLRQSLFIYNFFRLFSASRSWWILCLRVNCMLLLWDESELCEWVHKNCRL